MRLYSILFFSVFLITACSTTSIEKIQLNAQEPLVIPESEKTAGFIEIFDDRALALFDKDTKISIRGEGFDWIEGPTWVEDGRYLLFTDIPQNLIRKYEPKKGYGTTVYLKGTGSSVPGTEDSTYGSNSLLLDKQGRLVLFQRGDRNIAVMDAPLSSPKVKFIPLVDNYKGLPLNSPNDGVFHSDGSIFFTDPNYGLNNKDPDRKQKLGFQAIYRLSESGELRLLDDTLTFPNGIGLSPDEKTLYVAISDHDDAVWFAYDINEAGLAENKRRFYDANSTAGKPGHAGYPDGMAVHSSGVIFATGPGGVWVFNEDATLLAKIRTGQDTSNCTLTTDEEYLFMTADNYIMSIPLKR